MPYPDNFNSVAFDRHMSAPEDVLPTDAARLGKAQDAYRECVEACIAVFKKRGFTYLSKEDVSHLGFASGIEDVLADEVSSEISNIEDEGFTVSVRGDDHEAFFARMFALLKAEAPHA